VRGAIDVPDFRAVRSGVCVATITLARTTEEEALLRRSLAVLSGLGIEVVVTDGGSPRRFVEFARGLPHIDICSNEDSPGLVGQARTSLRRAAQGYVERILYVESDKISFFTTRLLDFLGQSRGDADLVLASRSARSFATYPASQRFAEHVINRVCSREVGLHTDYSYGPFVVSPHLVRALDVVPQAVGWGWRTYLFVAAHRQGHTIRRVEGDFECPVDQRTDTLAERRHRLGQLSQNLSGVVLALGSERPSGVPADVCA
jgi:hypothetical protein